MILGREGSPRVLGALRVLLVKGIGHPFTIPYIHQDIIPEDTSFRTMSVVCFDVIKRIRKTKKRVENAVWSNTCVINIIFPVETKTDDSLYIILL